MPVLRCPQCGRAYSYDRRKVGYGLICATPGCQTIIPVKSPVSRWLVACALGVCVALGVGYAFGHSAANKSVSAAAAPALVAASVPGPVLNTRKPHSHQSSLPPGLYVPTQAEAQQAGQEWARVRPQASQPTAAPVQKATAAPMFAVLLPTGTEVAPAQGAAGRGELTVVNGTGQDAVVKLAAAGRPDGPLVAFRTVYVQAGQQFTLGEIGAGTYTLFFVLGEDWNQAEQAFRQDDTYSQFQKPLTFTETSTRTDTDNGYRIGTRYSTFTVTLNPVPTGTARTTRISKAAFDALR